MSETGGTIRPEDITTTPETHRVPLDRKTIKKEPSVYGHYLNPSHPDNPFRGDHTLMVRESVNPKGVKQLIENVRNKTADCPVLPGYKDTRVAYVAMLERIGSHATDKGWLDAFKRTTRGHEDTHSVQEIRTQVLSAADEADSISGHWYEKPPYRKTREIKIQSFDLGVLTEVQATMAANRVQKDREVQKASAELEAVRYARVLQLFQKNSKSNKTFFDELWIYVKDSMLSECPVEYPTHILSYIAILTKNPHLIADIRAGKPEMNRTNLATTLQKELSRIAQNPAILSDIFHDDKFYIAVDQELMKQAETLKKNLHDLKN